MSAYPKSVAYTREFKMIDSSDHISKKTGLTCTVNISKAGGSFGAAGGTVTEIANGWYKVALTTTDTNTAGDLAFYITATGADDTDFCDQVTDPTVAVWGVNLIQILGTALTETVAGYLAAAFKKLFDIATPVLTSASVNQTGDGYARLGAPAGASVSADIAAIKTDSAAVKVQTDKLTFTVANQVDSNVLDWKSSTAPAMTGDAFARLGAPAGASVSADVAAVKTDSAAVKVQTDKLSFDASNFIKISSPLRKNTAFSAFEFLMTDSTTHAPATGKTVAVTRSIDGGAFGAGTLSAVTEISSGWYKVDFGAGDLNGSNIAFRATSAGCDDLDIVIFPQS